ncbi:MAG: tRNA (adenosine(37)-N6)-threonylcarbamoyltransferase complex transferase subunit TsaD, partial [Pseudomonadota bacterium]
APFGGVVPELASRRHVQDCVPVIRESLSVAGVSLSGIDGIAVTVGPGLIGALMVGTAVAGSMAWASGLPVVGVNHIRGHLMAVFLRPRFGEVAGEHGAPAFPFIALVVSGGHTSLFLVRSRTEIELLGRTRDDAAGEAFDKGAKIMGLGYPGGPEIERCAGRFDAAPSMRFPRGLVRSESLDFSFSGVKTALANHLRSQRGEISEQHRNELCRAYQDAIVDVLVKKALRACRSMGVARLVVSGGVAANGRLRAEFFMQCERASVRVFIPPGQYCTDNAAMIAYAGEEKLSRGLDLTGNLKAVPHLGIDDV